MICCLNLNCRQPQNPDDADTCRSCGEPLTPLLRGRYRVLQPLGQGGFGRTYLAVDEDRLKARCVLKQFSPQFQGAKAIDKAIQLFEQEAIRLHELGEHPQIPTLLAYFEHQERLYLVQQFIEGANLVQELGRQGPFNESKIRELFKDILPVLKYIHERQVIHRDITPGNIIRRAIDGRLVLIDFGVSKQLTGTSMAQVGTRIGTEGYAPMEQMRSGKAFPASDLYSLGATCIHLMTQVRPDELYDPLSGRWLWQEHLARKGVTVSDRLTSILDKLLKDLVNERYQSADEVLTDLNAEDSPSTSSPTPPPPPPTPTNLPPRTSTPPVSEPKASPPKTAASPPPRTTTAQPRPTSQPTTEPVGPQSSQFSWRCINTITGHSSWLTALTISADGQTLATGSLDDTIKLWHLQSGKLLFTLVGHTRAINCLDISPDGQTLVSGSDDDSIRIWHLPTRELRRTLTGHTRDVNSVAIVANRRAFSQEFGPLIVSGSEDRTVRLWKLDTGELVRTLSGTAGMVKAVAVSPRGEIMASGGLDNKVRLWSLNTGELLRTLTGHLNSINAIAMSPRHPLMATASKDKTIKLWHLQTGDLLRTLTGHTDMVNTVAIHPDGRTLLSGGSDKSIKLWKLPSGELLANLNEHLDSVNAVGFSPDGKFFASGSKDNTIRVWHASLSPS